MALQNVINDVVDTFGVEVIRDIRLVSILDDMHAFTDAPAAKSVLKEILRLGFGERLYELYETKELQWDVKIQSYTYTIVNNYGFREDIVSQLLNALSMALKFNIIADIWTEAEDEDWCSPITDRYGAVYSHDGRKLLRGPLNYDGNYKIMEGTIIICDESFWSCDLLRSVVIPKSVVCIGDDVFCGCAFMSSIEIPDSVMRIGECPFDICLCLQKIVIPIGCYDKFAEMLPGYKNLLVEKEI